MRTRSPGVAARHQAPRPTADLQWGRVFGVAIVVWVLWTGIWAATTPMYGVPDEPAHAARATSVARGEVLGTRTVVTREDPPSNAVFYIVDIPATLAASNRISDCYREPGVTADCMVPLPSTPGLRQAATSAGAYPPLYYALVGPPTRLSDNPEHIVLLGRLASAGLAALLLAAATATAWTSAGLPGLLGVVLAVTPMTLFLSGAINPNGVEIAGALALWVAVPAVLRDRRWRDGLVAIAGALGLAWARPSSPVVAVGVIVTGIILVSGDGRLRRAWGSAAVRRTGIGLVVAIGLSMMWIAATDAASSFATAPRPDLTPATAFDEVWASRGLYVEQMIGQLGWLDLPLPPWFIQGWVAGALVFGAVAVAVGNWRQRFLVASLAVGSFFIPIIVGTLTGAELGFVWQGRYTLPIAVGTMATAGWVIGQRSWQGVRAARVVVVGLIGVASVLQGYAVVQAIRRYATGPDTPLFAWVARSGWAPATTDPVMVVLLVAATVGLPAMAWWLSSTRMPPPMPMEPDETGSTQRIVPTPTI